MLTTYLCIFTVIHTEKSYQATRTIFKVRADVHVESMSMKFMPIPNFFMLCIRCGNSHSRPFHLLVTVMCIQSNRLRILDNAGFYLYKQCTFIILLFGPLCRDSFLKYLPPSLFPLLPSLPSFPLSFLSLSPSLSLSFSVYLLHSHVGIMSPVDYCRMIQVVM